MQYLIDRITAAYVIAQAPVPDDARPVNMSRAYQLIDGLDQHLGIATQGFLGARMNKIEEVLNTARMAVKPTTQLLVSNVRYGPGLLRLHRDFTFVFGDNSMRVGKGGQAVIRDEPNVLGVTTKRSPSEYFTDSPFDMGACMADLLKVERILAEGNKVLLPVTREGRISLGCGLAELPYRAPLVYATLEKWFADVRRRFKTQELIYG